MSIIRTLEPTVRYRTHFLRFTTLINSTSKGLRNSVDISIQSSSSSSSNELQEYVDPELWFSPSFFNDSLDIRENKERDPFTDPYAEKLISRTHMFYKGGTDTSRSTIRSHSMNRDSSNSRSVIRHSLLPPRSNSSNTLEDFNSHQFAQFRNENRNLSNLETNRNKELYGNIELGLHSNIPEDSEIDLKGNITLITYITEKEFSLDGPSESGENDAFIEATEDVESYNEIISANNSLCPGSSARKPIISRRRSGVSRSTGKHSVLDEFDDPSKRRIKLRILDVDSLPHDTLHEYFAHTMVRRLPSEDCISVINKIALFRDKYCQQSYMNMMITSSDIFGYIHGPELSALLARCYNTIPIAYLLDYVRKYGKFSNSYIAHLVSIQKPALFDFVRFQDRGGVKPPPSIISKPYSLDSFARLLDPCSAKRWIFQNMLLHGHRRRYRRRIRSQEKYDMNVKCGLEEKISQMEYTEQSDNKCNNVRSSLDRSRKDSFRGDVTNWKLTDTSEYEDEVSHLENKYGVDIRKNLDRITSLEYRRIPIEMGSNNSNINFNNNKRIINEDSSNIKTSHFQVSNLGNTEIDVLSSKPSTPLKVNDSSGLPTVGWNISIGASLSPAQFTKVLPMDLPIPMENMMIPSNHNNNGQEANSMGHLISYRRTRLGNMSWWDRGNPSFFRHYRKCYRFKLKKGWFESPEWNEKRRELAKIMKRKMTEKKYRIFTRRLINKKKNRILIRTCLRSVL